MGVDESPLQVLGQAQVDPNLAGIDCLLEITIVRSLTLQPSLALTSHKKNPHISEPGEERATLDYQRYPTTLVKTPNPPQIALLTQ